VGARAVVELQVEQARRRTEVDDGEGEILAPRQVHQVERPVGQRRHTGPGADAAECGAAGDAQDIVLDQCHVVDGIQFHVAQGVDGVSVGHGAGGVGDTEAELVVIGVTHQDIRPVLAVEVVGLQGRRRIDEIDGLPRTGREGAAGSGVPDADGLVRRLRHGQVGPAVAAEIGGRHGDRLRAQGGIIDGGERTAVVAHHRHRVAVAVGHRDVRPGIAVEVAGGERHRPIAQVNRRAAGKLLPVQNLQGVGGGDRVQEVLLGVAIDVDHVRGAGFAGQRRRPHGDQPVAGATGFFEQGFPGVDPQGARGVGDEDVRPAVARHVADLHRAGGGAVQGPPVQRRVGAVGSGQRPVQPVGCPVDGGDVLASVAVEVALGMVGDRGAHEAGGGDVLRHGVIEPEQVQRVGGEFGGCGGARLLVKRADRDREHVLGQVEIVAPQIPEELGVGLSELARGAPVAPSVQGPYAGADPDGEAEIVLVVVRFPGAGAPGEPQPDLVLALHAAEQLDRVVVDPGGGRSVRDGLVGGGHAVEGVFGDSQRMHRGAGG